MYKNLAKIEVDKETEPSIINQILNNTNSFLKNTAQGRNKQSSIQAKQAILTTCIFSEPSTMTHLDKIRDAIGITKHGSYARKVAQDKSVYAYISASKRKAKGGILQKKYVLAFCHSDDSLSIASNSRKIITVDKEKYVGRVWSAKSIKW